MNLLTIHTYIYNQPIKNSMDIKAHLSSLNDAEGILIVKSTNMVGSFGIANKNVHTINI